MVSGTRTPIDGTSVPGADALLDLVRSLHDPSLTDAEQVDRIRVLEELKSVACATQARLAVDLDTSQRHQHAEVGLPARLQGRGVASQVALARRESPVRGAQDLGLAKILLTEMPHALVALDGGWTSEWRVKIVARETACLSREDRARVDRELFGDPSTTEGWGDRRLAAEARRLAYSLDPHAVVARTAQAESERRVTVRPAPDTMAQLSVLLPATQGIAVFAVLGRHADSLIATGDGRTRGQIMADTLVERVTGQVTAAAVPVTVNLTVSDETLLDGGSEPAWLAGYGPLPAQSARDLVLTAHQQALAALRRVYVAPATGALTAMDSRASAFPAGLGLLVELRDQTCRTPWCDAPVRHHDHVLALLHGGPTSAVNGQGLCEQCNYAKEAPGWWARVATGPPGGVHTVDTTTPTGHSYRSRAPSLPRPHQHVYATSVDLVYVLAS